MTTLESLEKKLKASGKDKIYRIGKNSKQGILVLVNDEIEIEKRFFVAMYDIYESYIYVNESLTTKEKNVLFEMTDEDEWDVWTMKVVSNCTETGKEFESYDGYDYTGNFYEGCGFCYDCYETKNAEPWYQAELDATRGEQAKLAMERRDEVNRNKIRWLNGYDF